MVLSNVILPLNPQTESLNDTSRFSYDIYKLLNCAFKEGKLATNGGKLII